MNEYVRVCLLVCLRTYVCGGALSAAVFRKTVLSNLPCWQDDICLTWGKYGMCRGNLVLSILVAELLMTGIPMGGFFYGCMHVQLFVGMDGYTGVCMLALHSWPGGCKIDIY